MIDVDKIPFEKLKYEYNKLLYALGDTQARINYCDLKRFKINPYVQRNLIVLKDTKKRLETIKKRMEIRLKRGW